MVAKVGSLFVDLGANSASFAKDLGKSLKDLNSFKAGANRLLGGIDRAFTSLKKSAVRTIKSIFSLRGALATLAGSAGIGLVIKRFADFESGLTDVFTLLNKNTFGIGKFDAGIKQLSKDIKALRIESGKSFGDLNKGLFDLISAGIPAAKAIKTLRVATELATAGATTTAVAVDGLTSALNAFSIDASRAEEVAAKFFQAQKGGKTTIEELASGFGVVASSARAFGASLDEVLAATAAATLAGIKTSQAFTGLKAVFSNISKPTKDAVEEAKNLGIEFNTTALRASGLAKFLKSITESAAFTSTSIEKLFSSVEAQNIAFALTGAQAKDFAKILADLSDKSKSLTSLQDALAIKVKSAGQAFARLKATIDVIVVNVGEQLAPAFKDLTKNIIAAEPAISRAFKSIIAFASKVIKALTLLDDALKLRNIRRLVQVEKSITKLKKSLEEKPKGTFLGGLADFIAGGDRGGILKDLRATAASLKSGLAVVRKDSAGIAVNMSAISNEFDNIVENQTPKLIFEVGDLLKKYNEIADKALPKIASASELAAKKTAEVFKNAAAAIQSSFADLFKGGITGKLDLKGFAMGIADTFATTASNVLTANLSGVIASLVRSGGGAGGAGIANIFGAASGGGGGSIIGSLGTTIGSTLIKPVLASLGTAFGFGAAGTATGAAVGALGSGAIISGGVGSAAISATGVAGASAGAGAGAFGAAFAAAAPLAIAAIAIPLIIAAFSGKSDTLAGAVGTLTKKGIGGVISKSKNIGEGGVQQVLTQVGNILTSLSGLTDEISLVGQNIGVETSKEFGDAFRILGKKEFGVTSQIGEDIGLFGKTKFDASDAAQTQEATSNLILKLLELQPITGDLATALENIKIEGRETQEVLNDITFAATFKNLGKLPIFLTEMEIAADQLNAVFKEYAETAVRLGLAEENVFKARDKQLKSLRDSFQGGLEDRLLGLTDPSGLSFKNLDKEFANIRRNAFAIGADIVTVEEIFAQERIKILEGAGEASLSFFGSLKLSITELMGSAKLLSDRIRVDPNLSGLSKQARRSEALTQFGAAKAGFLGGTVNFAEVERTGLNLLDASKGFFSTTEGFYKDQAGVLDFLKSIENGSFAANDNTSILVTAAQQQTAELSAIRQLLSDQLIASQKVSDSQLLRGFETLDGITKLNELSELPNILVRKFKVISGFNFNAPENQSRNFAEAVRAGQASGEIFNRLISGVGGKTQQFANGGIGSGIVSVGERSQEFVNLGRGGRVMTQRQMANAMNDNSPVVEAIARLNDSVRVGVTQTTRQTTVLSEKLADLEEQMNAIQKQNARATAV